MCTIHAGWNIFAASLICYRTKTIRRQPIINGGINVEIGNPSYNMYEVGHNHNERGLSDFTLNPDKVIFNTYL